MKSGGIFSASYILYKISTQPVGFTIYRKDQDFYFLRKILQKCFPYVIIPPLPQKKKKESDKSIRRREKYFGRFLQAVCRSEELKSSEFLVDWLRNSDVKDFQKIMKQAEKVKYVRSMQSVFTK